VPLAARLRALLAWRAMTVTQLIERSGIGRSQVFSYLGGSRVNPTPETRAKLATALDVDTAVFGDFVERRGGTTPGSAVRAATTAAAAVPCPPWWWRRRRRPPARPRRMQIRRPKLQRRPRQ
jgi:transcriptional regulator with XRE-family HTH domain